MANKFWPALDVRAPADPDLALAAVDDFAPAAVEERDDVLRVFFSTASERDEARATLAARFDVASVDVPDEDWARRSQENLQPITVGRITVAPPWAVGRPGTEDRFSNSAVVQAFRPARHGGPEGPHYSGGEPPVSSPQPPAPVIQSRVLSPEPLTVVIQPSMGFGTGHHATTRLCLAALQAIDLRETFVVDVGTGSGVLAIAAVLLGAARAAGIDYDEDAIQSARENLALNPDAQQVTFEVADLATHTLPIGDAVTANLTGALLLRAASRLIAAVRPGGMMIVSGLLAHERDEVCRAFSAMRLVWEQDDEGWTGLMFRRD